VGFSIIINLKSNRRYCEGFETEADIKIQSYNKQNKISKNFHIKNKENILSQKIIDLKTNKSF